MAQDTWRVRKDLTVTFGLRYELFSPLLNRQNQLSNFSPDNGGGLVTADLERFRMVRALAHSSGQEQLRATLGLQLPPVGKARIPRRLSESSTSKVSALVQKAFWL